MPRRRRSDRTLSSSTSPTERAWRRMEQRATPTTSSPDQAARQHAGSALSRNSWKGHFCVKPLSA